MAIKRRFKIGAEIVQGEGVHFRVWAPGKKTADIVIFKDQHTPGEIIEMSEEDEGYFQGLVNNAGEDSLYKFRINGVDDYYPDPASRYQPFGPHGVSCVINPDSFRWSDAGWKGVDPDNIILYEMHIGTFTEEGTWKSAEERLKYLADTGVTILEIMPVAEFPGEFGWGYDGVYLFAPSRLYGIPEDFKSFINTAHNHNISVILDVVYNHFGPDGNYLGKFSEDYTTPKYETDWGAAINYDGNNSGGVREFFKTNARFWIEEYHLDGLRLDATQNIFDQSNTHILAEIHDEVRNAAGNKKTFIVTENEPQDSNLVRERSKGGIGFDAVWNDDFHHSAIVALTGRKEAYYTDYPGTSQEFISAAKYGFLYQGQYYKWQKKRRGKPSLDIPPGNFIIFTQNHDQIANSGRGRRIHKLSSPGNLRAMTALMFLSPQIPMLFQGQEFASSSPFYYFADHKVELAEAVRNGRHEFLSQFRSIASKEMIPYLRDPGSKDIFRECKLDHSEVSHNEEIYIFHKDLISLRKNKIGMLRGRIDGAVLNERCFVIRYLSDKGDMLLFINFSTDLNYNPAPEPLLAPVDRCRWEILWSSEHPKYGGAGTAPLETEDNWIIPGNSAVLLESVKEKEGNE